MQDEKIFIKKLEEISDAALEAAEYFDDTIVELEANQEEARVTEIENIKKSG